MPQRRKQQKLLTAVRQGIFGGYKFSWLKSNPQKLIPVYWYILHKFWCAYGKLHENFISCKLQI